MMGDHHHWRKTYAYQGSAAIPMVMKWPDSLKTEIKPGSTLTQPVELRDYLPTFLDISGLNIPADMDGDSLIKLLKKKDADWRDFIDLEHHKCYSKENDWNALTDGKYKYIFFSYNGKEQLFNLINDPLETKNLAGKPEHSKTLKEWRNKLVIFFEKQKRGPRYVKNGKLLKRKPILYSPHFPKTKA